jgi:farnesyl-diphosphate farnesyltransferase
MVLNAIGHSRDCLSYLAGLNEQSVFNFCAIPQTMALATLQLCFRNPAIFQHNVKLKKGDTLHLMIDSSRDIESVAKIFSHYIRQIHQKNDPRGSELLDHKSCM